MYYHLFRYKSRVANRIFSIFLALFFILSIFQAQVFADTKNQQATEYRLQAYQAQQSGDLEKALSLYAKAAYLIPDAAVYNDMGVIYEQMGLQEKAAQQYFKAIQIDSRYLPAYSNLAYLHDRAGELEKAAEYFKKRIELSDEPDAWTQRAKERLYHIGQKLPHIGHWVRQQDVRDLNWQLSQEAQRNFEQKIGQSHALFQEAQKLEKDKRYQQAALKYEQALALTPQNRRIMAARDRARLEMIKQDVNHHADLAIRFLNLGDTASARAEFRKILSIIPNEPIRVSR